MNRIAVGIRPAAAQVGKAHTELVGLAITKRHVPDADGFPCYGRGSATIQVAGEVVSNTKGLAVASSEIRRHPEVSLAQAVQLDRCDTHRVLAEEMLAEVAKLEFTLDSRKGGPGPHTDPSNIDAIGIPDTIPIGRGGWLYATFAANTTYSSLLPPEPIIRLYAARIPPLNVEWERTLFAPCSFPYRRRPSRLTKTSWKRRRGMTLSPRLSIARNLAPATCLTTALIRLPLCRTRVSSSAGTTSSW